MKKLTLLTLTLVLMVAMAVTTANAQQYVHTRTIRLSNAVYGLAFKDNGTLISGSGDHSLRAWDVTTGTQHWRKDVGGVVLAVALPSHDPHFIAYGGSTNHNIRFRLAADAARTGGTASGHTNNVESLAFQPDRYLLASGSKDKTIRIWDVSDPDNPRHLRTMHGHTNNVETVAWSPNGRTLASGSDDHTVRLWDPNTGSNFAVLRGHTNGVEPVVWSPNGRMLATGSYDDTIRIWNPNTDTTLRILRGHTHDLDALAFHPNGQTLASGSTDKTIRLWNPNNGNLKTTLTGHSKTVNALAFSPNGQILASGSDDETIRIWMLVTLDVTGNGKVNVNDLVEVARNYGKTVGAGANRKADINQDGKVDIDDLILVAEAVDAAGAPALTQEDIEPGSLQASDVHRWIRDAKAADADPAGIAALERLLAALTRVEAPPEKTVLLANYPNPFNPETWIPYQLSEAAEVTVTIHSSDGKLVRTLELGQMPAGAYSDKARAAYWDGRNAQGEPVASGVYFYTLTAGDFSATRKMVIRK